MLQTVTYYTHAVITFNLPIFDRIRHKGIYGRLGILPEKPMHRIVTISSLKPRIFQASYSILCL